MTEGRRIYDAAAAKAFMLAGNATFTLVSRATGARFTYKVQAPPETEDVGNYVTRVASYFVKLMNGPDNESSYAYLGMIARAQHGGAIPAKFIVTKASKIDPSAPSALAFKWAFMQLQNGRLPDVLEFWHEGRCGRCGRKLTVPSSIEAGIGPECAGKGERI